MARTLVFCLFMVLEGFTQPCGAQPHSATPQGLIDGHPALAMWPTYQEREPIPGNPSGFKVHLIPGAAQSREVVKPAGTWFLLDQPGPYRWFLEAVGFISKHEGVVMWGAGQSDQGLKMLGYVVPAGTVVLDPGISLKPGYSIRLYSVTRRFFRQVRGPEACAPVQMPPGGVLALLHDDANDSWLAMSRVANADVKVPGVFRLAEPPAPTTDLLVKVSVQGVLLKEEAPGIVVDLDTGTQQKAPDLVFHDPGTVYAAWWGLDQRRGTVRFSCPGVLPLQHEVSLPGGVLQTADLKATPGGTLTVDLALPSGLKSPSMALTVLDGGGTLEERAISDTVKRVVFFNVPAHVVVLALVSGVWRVTQVVDMSGGGDQSIVFAPAPIRVTGAITKCGKPTVASVGFLANDSAFTWAEATTGEDGRFDEVVFHPITLIRVGLSGRSPFLQPLSQGIARDTVWDFDLPCNSYTVHVRDAANGQPIADAKVSVLNQGKGSGVSDETSTDDQGMASLHPLRPGTVVITARAEGYSQSRVREDVPERQTEKQIDIALEPTGHGAKVRFVLPDGSPAAGARVAAVAADGASLLWDGTCDQTGKVLLPNQPGAAFLLARHPGAGLYAGLWPREQEGMTSNVMAPLGPTRRLVARLASGRLASWAALAVWVNGIPLWESALAWATDGSPMCGIAGEYIWAGGPSTGVEVLSWARTAQTQFAAGSLNGLRVEWPPTGVLRLTTFE